MNDYERVHIIKLTIGEDDFVDALGRKPDNPDEFETFCRYCEKGIYAYIDWNILFQWAKDAMQQGSG